MTVRAVRPPRWRATAGDLLAAMPPVVTSADVWGAEGMILRLPRFELRRLRYALAARMSSDEYRSVWRYPLGGLVAGPTTEGGVVSRAMRYAREMGWTHPQALPDLAVRRALLDAQKADCPSGRLAAAAGILSRACGVQLDEMVPREVSAGAPTSRERPWSWAG